MTQHYEGSCHCGAIKFSYDGEKIDKGLRCNCSICARKGAIMSTEVIASDNLNISTEDDAPGLYQFGAKTAKHYFCKNCGIYTHHETARFPDHYRVNLGCIEGIESTQLDADIFDGKHLL